MKRFKGMNQVKLCFLMSVCLLFILTSTADSKQAEMDQVPGRTMARQATKAKALWSTTDHSKHEALQQAFKSGEEITRACLSCHSESRPFLEQLLHFHQ